jgi:hypothetical protein
MTMRGELGTFSAAEILQLIGSQEKSGVLQVRNKGRTAVIFFDSGKIISARDRRQSASDPFLTYLLENGEISIQDLHKVLEAKKNEGGDAIEIMLRDKIIDENKLGDWLSRYTLQIVTNIVKWEAGTYEFAASCDGMPDKIIGTPLRLEPILMEALRRKDETEEIRRFLPGLDARLEIAEPNYETLPLEQEDLTVLRLVNGDRTLDEIIEESGVDEVETLDILEKLFALGIISIAATTTQTTSTKKISAKKTLVMTGVMIAASVGLRFGLIAPGHTRYAPAVEMRMAVADFVEVREIRNVRLALEAYKTTEGTYPDNLQRLVTARLLTADQIRDRYRRPYPYRHLVSNDSYLLSQ